MPHSNRHRGVIEDWVKGQGTKVISTLLQTLLHTGQHGDGSESHQARWVKILRERGGNETWLIAAAAVYVDGWMMMMRSQQASRCIRNSRSIVQRTQPASNMRSRFSKLWKEFSLGECSREFTVDVISSWATPTALSWTSAPVIVG